MVPVERFEKTERLEDGSRIMTDEGARRRMLTLMIIAGS